MIEIYNQSEKKVPRTYLKSWVEFVFKTLENDKILHDDDPRAVVIVFMDPGPAQELNLQYRQKDYPTDVLSFDSGDPESLGDLILCSEVVERQAKEHKLSFREECAYLILHGILHLLGFEHENDDKEAERMYSVQDKVFEKIKSFA